jgi:hypothetical protein
MVLARTDWEAPKHTGLTMFIVPLRAEGMTVLPLRQLTGSAEFCQEFLDDVAVPHGDVLGGVNNGWAVATSLFNHSRTMTSGGGLAGPVFATSRGGDPDPGRDLIDWAKSSGVNLDGACANWSPKRALTIGYRAGWRNVAWPPCVPGS